MHRFLDLSFNIRLFTLDVQHTLRILSKINDK